MSSAFLFFIKYIVITFIYIYFLYGVQLNELIVDVRSFLLYWDKQIFDYQHTLCLAILTWV